MCDKRVRRFCSVLACASECTFHHFFSLHPCLNPPLFPPSFPLSFPAFLSPSLSLTLPFKSEDQIDISQSAGGKELSRHCGHERAAQGERERQREEERERESFCESEQERVGVIVCDCVCVLGSVGGVWIDLSEDFFFHVFFFFKGHQRIRGVCNRREWGQNQRSCPFDDWLLLVIAYRRRKQKRQ